MMEIVHCRKAKIKVLLVMEIKCNNINLIHNNNINLHFLEITLNNNRNNKINNNIVIYQSKQKN